MDRRRAVPRKGPGYTPVSSMIEKPLFGKNLREENWLRENPKGMNCFDLEPWERIGKKKTGPILLAKPSTDSAPPRPLPPTRRRFFDRQAPARTAELRVCRSSPELPTSGRRAGVAVRFGREFFPAGDGFLGILAFAALHAARLQIEPRFVPVLCWRPGGRKFVAPQFREPFLQFLGRRTRHLLPLLF